MVAFFKVAWDLRLAYTLNQETSLALNIVYQIMFEIIPLKSYSEQVQLIASVHFDLNNGYLYVLQLRSRHPRQKKIYPNYNIYNIAEPYFYYFYSMFKLMRSLKIYAKKEHMYSFFLKRPGHKYNYMFCTLFHIYLIKWGRLATPLPHVQINNGTCILLVGKNISHAILLANFTFVDIFIILSLTT